MSAPTPETFLGSVIETWEGGYSSDPDDPGNYYKGELLGSMRGVTGAALAKFYGRDVTADDVRAVTLLIAVEIGLTHYYIEPHFDKLPWGPATASLLDFGWGSGPGQAALSMQRLVHVNADGVVGPITIAAYAKWEADLGWLGASDAMHSMRASFYRHICEVNPVLNKYLQGWLNRNDWASNANWDWAEMWGKVVDPSVASPE